MYKMAEQSTILLEKKIINLLKKAKEYDHVEKKAKPVVPKTSVIKVVEKKVKTPAKKAKKVYWASKTGKKFHDKHCPFAKNIKPKSRVVFKTKNTALNKGLKPCKCV